MLTIITILAYTLCTIGDISACILRYAYYLSYSELTPIEAYFAGAKDVIYYSGNVTFFILLFQRIQTSFRLSKCTMIYLSSLLTISMLSSLAWCLIVFITAQDSQTLSYDLLFAWYPLTISDFLLNLSLFILFLHKIKRKDTIEGVEAADDISVRRRQPSLSLNYNYDHDHDKQRIWNVMIKHCVLFGIALISNQSWYIVNFAGPILIQASSLSNGFIREYTARAIENTINVIVLWLVLKINNEKYVKVCKCWHSCILKYCMKEDPDVIREGFGSHDKQSILIPIGSEDSNKLFEGPHFVATEHHSDATQKVHRETHYI